MALPPKSVYNDAANMTKHSYHSTTKRSPGLLVLGMNPANLVGGSVENTRWPGGFIVTSLSVILQPTASPAQNKPQQKQKHPRCARHLGTNGKATSSSQNINKRDNLPTSSSSSHVPCEKWDACARSCFGNFPWPCLQRAAGSTRATTQSGVESRQVTLKN